MHQVEDWAEVHRLFHREGMAKAAIARRLGMSRNTVDRLLTLREPPRYVRGYGRTNLVDPVRPSCSHRPQVTSFSPPGEGARPTDNEAVYAIEITTVGGDVSLPDGKHLWFYDLRRAPGGAWRVYGGGSGP